jgi:FAD synthetase
MATRILCSGTFDRLHTGHVGYMKAAKALASDAELIVIVARDKTSKRIKDKIPKNDEKTRLSRVRRFDFVDKAVLGFLGDKAIKRVVSLSPDILALGHDQWAKEEWLAKELGKSGVNCKIVRMPKFEKRFLNE